MTEDQTLTEQLEQFASSVELSDLVRNGQPFLKTAAAAKAAKSELFAYGLEKIIQKFDGDESEQQLLSIAFAWRLTSVTAMRRHRQHLIKCLNTSSPKPMYLPITLTDPDDRKNLAEALQWKADDWVFEYLIQFIANEKDGKLARIAACESILTKNRPLTLILDGLAVELKNLELDQIDATLGRARQLINILDALGAAIWVAPTEIDLGNEFGSNYRKLLDSLVYAGEISERSVRLSLALSAIDFYLKLARLKGTLAAQSESYDFVRSIKKIFAPADWPSELTEALDVLARRVAEQLVFMTQLGKPDKDLRDLILYLKGDVAGKIFLRKIADLATSLSPDDRYWLENGRGRKTLSTERAIGESALTQYDASLANMYKSADSLSEISEAAQMAFSDEADILSDNTASKIRRHFSISNEMMSKAGVLFGNRNLRLRGRIGEIVEFNPVEHDPSASAVGEKMVRLTSKIVERSLDNGRWIIVSKADVDKT